MFCGLFWLEEQKEPFFLRCSHVCKSSVSGVAFGRVRGPRAGWGGLLGPGLPGPPGLRPPRRQLCLSSGKSCSCCLSPVVRLPQRPWKLLPVSRPLCRTPPGVAGAGHVFQKDYLVLCLPMALLSLTQTGGFVPGT